MVHDEILEQETREQFRAMGMREAEIEFAIEAWRDSGAFDVQEDY